MACFKEQDICHLIILLFDNLINTCFNKFKFLTCLNPHPVLLQYLSLQKKKKKRMIKQNQNQQFTHKQQEEIISFFFKFILLEKLTKYICITSYVKYYWPI